jgi:DNA polymerase-1
MTFYKDFAEPAMIALARASSRGVLVDVTERNRIVTAQRAKLDDLRGTLGRVVGRDINPDSPKQVKGLLYDELRLPVQYKRSPTGHGQGPVTCDAEAVRKLRRLCPQHETLLTALVDYRSVITRLEAYETKLETRADGCSYFVTNYNATGTVTGRISSSAPIHIDAGGNLQNRERGPSRRMFVSRHGMSFIKCDGSQAEARVVAALMRDERWLEKFRDPTYDVHVENASYVYTCRIGDITAETNMTPAERTVWRQGRGLSTNNGCKDSLRQEGKPVTHGAHYKIGPHGVAKIGDMPFLDAKRGLLRYTAARQPLLGTWWERVEEMLRTTRSIRTVWGRLRIFLGRCNDQTIREAVAHEPQSTIGDLINHAFFVLDEELAPLGAYPLIQAHDEIVVEAPDGAVGACVPLIRTAFEVPLTFPGIAQPLVIPADIAVGKNWYNLKKVR